MRASSVSLGSGRRGVARAAAPQTTLLDRVGNRGMTQLVQRQAARGAIDRQVAEPMSNGCYTCQIPGGIGVCCYAPDAPWVDECFELGKHIIDSCQGRPTDCLQQAQCAQCKCIAEKRGDRYCVCTGIV
jgi:hypothetical protein